MSSCSFKDKGWLEAQIEANNIKLISHADLSEIEKVGEGGFSTIYKACWKSRRMTVALKTLKTLKFNSICELVNEVNIIIKMINNCHIIKILTIVGLLNLFY